MPRPHSDPRTVSGAETPRETPSLAAAGASWVPQLVDTSPDPAGTTDEELDFKRYWMAVRQRWGLVVGCVLIAGALGTLYTLRQPKLYKASVSLVIDKSTPKVLTGVTEVVEMGTGGWWADEAFYQTEYAVIASRDIARRAAEKLGLLPEEPAPDGTLDPADAVLGRYTVEPDKQSQIVRVAVVDPDPQLAANLANAVGDAYRESNVDRRVDATREASTWLTTQHYDLRRKLEAAEDALYRFMEDNAVLNASLESQMDEVNQRLKAFNARLAEVQASRIESGLEAKALAEVRSEPALLDSLAEIQDAAVINTLKTKRIELTATRTDLSARYLDAHPKLKAIDEQIALLEQNLAREVDAVLVSLDRRQASLATTESGLKAAIAKEREREARLNRLSLEYGRLHREVETASKLYELVTGRMKEAELTGALRLNNVRILDVARVPAAPFKPSIKNNLALSILLGLLIGAAIAIALELLDNTLKTQEDVQQLSAVPFLGLLPVISGEDGATKGANDPSKMHELRGRDLYVLRKPKSQPAECARFIRTNLMFMSPDRPLKSLVITSPSPNEGKTTTAVSLAVTMAQAGGRVLLVDSDMRRPRLHRVFGLTSEQGLSTAILGEAEFDAVIQKSEVPGLDILVCGPIPPNPAELLHTERFREILELATQRYDRVLLDAPPVGAVTDPVILGAHADGAVLVFKAQSTTKQMGRQALRAMQDANVNLFGIVLNDVDLHSKRYGATYYQYYRRYGGYYGESEASGGVSAG